MSIVCRALPQIYKNAGVRDLLNSIVIVTNKKLYWLFSRTPIWFGWIYKRFQFLTYQLRIHTRHQVFKLIVLRKLPKKHKIFKMSTPETEKIHVTILARFYWMLNCWYHLQFQKYHLAQDHTKHAVPVIFHTLADSIWSV